MLGVHFSIDIIYAQDSHSHKPAVFKIKKEREGRTIKANNWSKQCDS